MRHARRWCIDEVEDDEELARLITANAWALCTGFELEGYLFLNDSTSRAAAQVYAVVKRPAAPGGPFLHLESITFGASSQVEALTYVRTAVAGDMDATSSPWQVWPQLETPATHVSCHHCA
jgi:hypothetical protein